MSEVREAPATCDTNTLTLLTRSTQGMLYMHMYMYTLVVADYIHGLYHQSNGLDHV